ncbi:MAG: hypothetical protein ACI9R3_003648 [Verrucomicrobiales bacterium]|jgi:hypothetical protein
MTSDSVDSYFVVIEAETGRVVDEDDNRLLSGQPHAYIPLVMPRDGAPLIVRASSSNPLEAGTYTLSATPGPQHSIGTTTSNKLSSTDPINIDGSHRNTYFLTGHTPGQPVIVTLTSSAFDTYLQLTDGRNKLLDSNDDAPSAGGTNSRLSFTPNAHTNYLLQVTSLKASVTGLYTLSSE